MGQFLEQILEPVSTEATSFASCQHPEHPPEAELNLEVFRNHDEIELKRKESHRYIGELVR
jgi:hypothetical protein